MTKILIVEDSKTDLFAVKAMLERHGFEILVAETGESSLELASRERPDVILMDIVMPGMSGFQAIRRLGKQPETRDIPVIVLSSKDQDSDKEWARRQGAQAYITKPPEEGGLVETISSVLAAA